MCFDMKNGKKIYFSGEIPVNDCRNVWRGLKSIRLIFKKNLRISKVSCKESSRSQSLRRVERIHSVVISRGELIVNETSTTSAQRAIFRPFCMHHCTYCIMDHYSIGKLMNEVSATVRCDRYPFYFHLFPPKTRQDVFVQY